MYNMSTVSDVQVQAVDTKITQMTHNASNSLQQQLPVKKAAPVNRLHEAGGN